MLEKVMIKIVTVNYNRNHVTLSKIMLFAINIQVVYK